MRSGRQTRRLVFGGLLPLLLGLLPFGRPATAEGLLPAAGPAAGLAPTPAASPAPTARPLLWRIAGPRPSYLFGTIHLPDPRVLTLGAEVTQALEHVEAIYTELPLGLPTKLGAAFHLLLPLGQTLDTLVPADLLLRADRALRRQELSIEAFGPLKVWVLTVTLGMVDQLPQLTTGDSLDQQLYSLGTRRGKEVGGLETVAEQVAAFDTLEPTEQVQLLRETLDELERPDPESLSPSEQLLRLYLAGDEEQLYRQALGPRQHDSQLEQKLARALIEERNQRFAARIVEKLTARPDRACFFAVGAGHFGGPTGLPRLLRERGWQVERLGGPAAGNARPGVDKGQRKR